MGAFVAEVALRWSDMDAFGHVNHARTVTLLEEARVQLLFAEAGRRGLVGMAEGTVVARVAVDYHAPVDHREGPLRVSMWVRDLRAASFVLDYSARVAGGARVASAETLMVPYDLGEGRPRRLTGEERAFLAGWQLAGEESAGA